MGHKPIQDRAFGEGRKSTQTNPWDRRGGNAQPAGPKQVDIAIPNGVVLANPTRLKFVKPLRSYSVRGFGKRAGKICDAVGAAFTVLECAIERGDELKLSLGSCIEGPHFANALLCIVVGGYAELCSPRYPRRRLGAHTMLPIPNTTGVQCLSESSVARLIYAISTVNETSSSVTVPSTK